MKIIAADFSPFVSRVKSQLKLKDLSIPCVAPEQPLRTPEFKQHYPLGKVPVLVLDSGEQIPESTAIMRYLEREFPEPSLIPELSIDQARMDILINLADLYLGPAVFSLFNALINPAQLDKDKQLQAIQAELNKLELFFKQKPVSLKQGITIADLCLSTTLYFAESLPKIHNMPNPVSDFPLIMNWWSWVRDNAIVNEEILDMDKQFQAFAKRFQNTVSQG